MDSELKNLLELLVEDSKSCQDPSVFDPKTHETIVKIHNYIVRGSYTMNEFKTFIKDNNLGIFGEELIEEMEKLG